MTAIVLILISAVLWGVFLLWINHAKDVRRFAYGVERHIAMRTSIWRFQRSLRRCVAAFARYAAAAREANVSLRRIGNLDKVEPR